MRDKYDFLHEENQSFLQAKNVIFTGHSQMYLKYPKEEIYNFLYLKKGWRNEMPKVPKMGNL